MKEQIITQSIVYYIISAASYPAFTKESDLVWILYAFIILVVMLFFILLTKYLKINKKKKKVICELQLKEMVIAQKEEHTKVLEIKLNETFAEIIELAKQNHPHFYTRFREVYPGFQSSLLSINPMMRNSELILLAYIYLDFKTKEIADYMFRSPRTIQNRKHLLRKKLNIHPDQDMYVWLKSNTH